ncbi:hypothetical protein SLEP1_g9421 [Rubroshorea leprosula]|uniref:LAGLIDADG homing endonuclease n=1 Tax=Rubroshorea leprosula TaxID=152421 RepID=A0AAV5IER2_9ROSI|nr:hypothetical protein SLEP1_g9421 [Rubroshorea leprosula]
MMNTNKPFAIDPLKYVCHKLSTPTATFCLNIFHAGNVSYISSNMNSDIFQLNLKGKFIVHPYNFPTFHDKVITSYPIRTRVHTAHIIQFCPKVLHAGKIPFPK